MPAKLDGNSFTCETCKFFSARTQECRINPPTAIVKDDLGVISFWPKTTNSDWCGSHSLIPGSYSPSWEKQSLDMSSFSARAAKLLGRLQINTVGELVGLTELQIASVKNVGSTTIQEVVSQVLALTGIEWDDARKLLNSNPSTSIPDWYSISIERLDLPSRCLAGLRRNSVWLLGKVVESSERVIERFKGVSQEGIEALSKAIRRETGMTWEESREALKSCRKTYA